MRITRGVAAKYMAVGGALLGAVGLAQASIVDYASLATAVTTELSSGVTAAMAGVGVIWGARIGLHFVRSIFK
jgi:uncharacterized YccA/Bax inhibitor family protein